MLNALIVIATTGAGLITGLLFVFSNCVMQSFAEMPGSEGMRAMQLVNRKIQNPLFFALFFGTTLVSIAVGVLAMMQRPAGFEYMVAGAFCCVLGPFVITAARNVPLNNALDRASLDTPEGLDVWRNYLQSWTRWNHVRVVIGTAGVVLLLIGLA